MKEKGKLFSDLKKYWKQPKESGYVSFRKITAFSVVGMDIRSVTKLQAFLLRYRICSII